MKNYLNLILFWLLLLPLSGFVHAQSSFLQAGPMVGYSEMREVMLWVQTKEAAEVKVKYWEKGQLIKEHATQAIRTEKSKAFTAHLLCDEVLPGKTYEYELLINGRLHRPGYALEFQTIPDWLYHSEPPTIRIALGSCTYVNDEAFDRNGEPYGGGYQIFSSILDKDPDLMIWLGDNTYYRAADYGSRTGMVYRNTHTRSLPEMQALLGSVHHYAIWDDHDYGPNDSNGSFSHKADALEVFKLFWANTGYEIPGVPGNVSHFTWGDAEFFMLDNRWNRSANLRTTGEPQILGETQVDWLINALASSRANWKFVCVGGMVLSTAEVYENHIRLAPKERQSLIDRLQKEGIQGVIFLDGDRHHSEVSFMSGSAPMYDLTVSPLTSGAHTTLKESDEPNNLRIKGSLISERNFAVLEIGGEARQRVMSIVYYDSDGKELWKSQIDWKEIWDR